MAVAVEPKRISRSGPEVVFVWGRDPRILHLHGRRTARRAAQQSLASRFLDRTGPGPGPGIAPVCLCRAPHPAKPCPTPGTGTLRSRPLSKEWVPFQAGLSPSLSLRLCMYSGRAPSSAPVLATLHSASHSRSLPDLRLRSCPVAGLEPALGWDRRIHGTPARPYSLVDILFRRSLAPCGVSQTRVEGGRGGSGRRRQAWGTPPRTAPPEPPT